ncbi:hypothetical protein H9Y04_36085 [Streptomyces sp. TRM66268-LWL]|uniref:DUF4232 domain-containing protein n=1 Tax=Streptomyces polyasparticus TaxID=2767826 RepID=A0ABR7SR30_9ACTN|nr:hypothetical protein [Streptomyces polyasparticus]MBC9717966.1 hypothetical protein [Streptomyces polyasparticus]
MGSLRNPVGPLPSSIYWRRRAALLTVLGLLTLLIVWAVTSGGGGGNGGDANGKNPAPSITPGPDGSGPAISERPGGRDESGDSTGADSGGGSGEDGGTGEDSGGTDGANGTGGDGDSGGAGGSAGSGSGVGSSAGSGSGEQLPAGSSIPNCRASDLELTIESAKNRYEPGEKPKVEIVAKNSASADCKVDLGPKELVVTITKAGDDSPYWKSADCPATAGSLLYRVPGNSAITYTLNWDRKPSEANCASPAPGSASPGTYLVEAKGEGTGTLRASFVLDEA